MLVSRKTQSPEQQLQKTGLRGNFLEIGPQCGRDSQMQQTETRGVGRLEGKKLLRCSSSSDNILLFSEFCPIQFVVYYLEQQFQISKNNNSHHLYLSFLPYFISDNIIFHYPHLQILFPEFLPLLHQLFFNFSFTLSQISYSYFFTFFSFFGDSFFSLLMSFNFVGLMLQRLFEILQEYQKQIQQQLLQISNKSIQACKQRYQQNLFTPFFKAQSQSIHNLLSRKYAKQNINFFNLMFNIQLSSFLFLNPFIYFLLTFLFIFLISNFCHHFMIRSFQAISYDANQPVSTAVERTSKVQGLGSNKSYPSENTLCGDQNSVQLMIRAHQKIRTLEEDNEILRMHVQVLTKDNKDLSQKVVRIKEQKKEWAEQNEELTRKVKQLQRKLDDYEKKDRIEREQKQKYPRIQEQKARTNDQISQNKGKIISGDAKQSRQDQIDNKIVKQHQHLPSQCYDSKSQNTWQLGHRRLSSMEKSVGKDDNLCNVGYSSSNIGVYKSQDQLQNKKCMQKKLSAYFQTNFQYSRHSECLESNNPRPPRNSCQRFSGGSENLDENRQKQQWQIHRQSRYAKYLNASYDNKQKNEQSQKENGYYLSKMAQVRSISPLIRKNSPVRQSKAQCQFHSQSRTGTSWTSSSQNQSGLHKKFNYTNWRKTNNNMMVWKVGSNNKPIMLNR